MKKTSKTSNSRLLMDSLQVNSSLQNWRYDSRYQKPKTMHHSHLLCNSCGSQMTHKDPQALTQITENQSMSIDNKFPLTPIYKHLVMIPDVSKSVSRHKEGSKLSIQLNQISLGFNKENKRIQEALFEIRQSSVKKEKEKYLKSMSLSKKSQTSKNGIKPKMGQSIVKILNFQDLSKEYRKQSKKQNSKVLLIQKPKLKKKNLNQLMKQQRTMLKNLGAHLRNS